MGIDRELEARTALARWVLACLIASGVGLAGVEAALLPGRAGWQPLACLGLDLAFLATCAVALLRARGGDPARAVQIGYVALFAVLFTTGCLVDQPLLLLGSAVAFAILATAPRIFPLARVDVWAYVAVVGALVLGVLELVPLPVRAPAEPAERWRDVAFVAALIAAGALALREFPRYPLKFKLTLTTLLVALAPLVVARVDSYLRLEAIDAEAALSDMSQRAAASARAWDHLLARQLAPLRALAAGPDALAACTGDLAARARIEAQLRALLAAEPDIVHGAGLWGAVGESLVGVGSAFPDTSAPTAPVAFVAGPDGLDVLVLSAPVRDGDAASAGTLALVLRPGLVRAWSEATADELGAVVVLRDRDDRVLGAGLDALAALLPAYAALPPPPPEVDLRLPPPPRAPNQDTVAARLEGERRLAGVARIAVPDWTLALVRAAPDATVVAAERERRMQWVTLFVAALASAGAFALSRRLAAPIARLAAAMSRFGAGNTEVTPNPAAATDEIGELERRFDQMAEQTQSLVRSLEQQTRRLQAEVSERSEQERRLQALNRDLSAASDQAQAANRAKSTFLAHMSHELRTPLTAIIGYGEMLQDQARETDQQDVARDAQNIVESAQHLLTIINEILDLSKIEAGKMDMVLEDFDAAKLVREVADVVKPIIAGNRNRLLVEIEEDPAPMYTDRMKLRQALLNLLGNAAKFTQDGEVAIGLKQRTAAGLICLVFTVRDTGPGIPEAALQSLFDPFTQVNYPAVKKPSGTGLGLAITRRFCRLMGGEIAVSSTVGTGSTFTITLPVSYRGIRESSSWRPHRAPMKMDETARIKF